MSTTTAGADGRSDPMDGSEPIDDGKEEMDDGNDPTTELAAEPRRPEMASS